jgi:hypothetical protein
MSEALYALIAVVVIVVVVLLLFRDRIGGVKIGHEKLNVNIIINRADPQRNQGGFVGITQIKQAVEQSPRFEQGVEQVRGHLTLYNTSSQTTYLIASSQRLYLVVDERDRRPKQALEFKFLDLGNEEPEITTRRLKDGRTVVNIGPRRGWLYNDFSPGEIKTRIQNLLALRHQQQRNAEPGAAPDPAGR